jgi:hypothetical protein
VAVQYRLPVVFKLQWKDFLGCKALKALLEENHPLCPAEISNLPLQLHCALIIAVCS